MISIFPNSSVKFTGIAGDPQPFVNYHFDAILRYTVDQKTRYSSYPIEFGADMQDHAYNEPDRMIIAGYTGSRELRASVNNLPALGAQVGAEAVIGRINNPVLSAASGIFATSASYLAGDNQTRGGTTLEFLTKLKQKFTTFTVVTGLITINNVKIDRIVNTVNEENETGLEFIVELSQLRVAGEEKEIGNVAANLSVNDPAKSQASPTINRGRVSVE